jgi:hypothetical protein
MYYDSDGDRIDPYGHLRYPVGDRKGRRFYNPMNEEMYALTGHESYTTQLVHEYIGYYAKKESFGITSYVIIPDELASRNKVRLRGIDLRSILTSLRELNYKRAAMINGHSVYVRLPDFKMEEQELKPYYKEMLEEAKYTWRVGLGKWDEIAKKKQERKTAVRSVLMRDIVSIEHEGNKVVLTAGNERDAELVAKALERILE